MSNFGFFTKPPVLVAAIVLLALMGLSLGLRNQTEESSKPDDIESTEFDRMKTGSTRITGSSSAGRISKRDRSSATQTPVKKSAPRKAIVEDFNTALRRAEGDSVITGRVYGSLTESGDRGFGSWFGSGGGFGSGPSTGGQAPPQAQGGSEETTPSASIETIESPSESIQSQAGDEVTSLGDRRRNREDRATSDSENRRELRRSTDNSSATASNDWRSRMGDIKPIENAEIMLYENDPNTTHPALRTVKTDKEGSFTITNINGNDQRYILVVKADKFAPEATFVSVNNVPRQVFIRLGKGYPLKGRVLDSETSQPIPGAVVYQPNPRFETSSAMGVTTTSLNGEFFFPYAHRGGNVTQARAEGYSTARARIRVPDDETIIPMDPGGGVISGVTIDRISGKPQGGARVWATGERDLAESVISAPDGTFAIKNLPAGDFTVYAMRGMKSEEQKISLERAETVADLSILLPAELLVSGQVISTKDRSPLPNVKVWFDSVKGTTFKKTNSDGRFAFETMAIDKYAILIHEKGYLPVQDKRTTEAKETIERTVSKNQSSDDLVIRLKPVPMIEGNVTGQSRRERGDQPINDAAVTLAFEDDSDFIQMKTKSDPAGNFFFNLPGGERGKGILVASKDYALDSKDVRAPRKNPVKLKLTRDIMMAQILLVDQTPLDGIRVEVTRALSSSREDSKVANRVTLADLHSMREGRLFGALPQGQQVSLDFHMPDGATVSKTFQTDRLLNSRPIFIYDPVSQDIIADTTPRQSNRNNRRGQGQSGNGQGNGGPRGNQGNNGAPSQTGQTLTNDGATKQ